MLARPGLVYFTFHLDDFLRYQAMPGNIDIKSQGAII